MRLARERGSTMGVRKWLESLTVVLRGVADPFPASGGLRRQVLHQTFQLCDPVVADPFPASGDVPRRTRVSSLLLFFQPTALRRESTVSVVF